MNENGSAGRCSEVVPLYVNRSLGGAARVDVAVHLDSCPSCATEYEEWDVIAAAMQASVAEIPSPPRGLLDRVWLKIDAEQGATPRRNRGVRLHPRTWLMGAGALAAVVAALTLVAGGGRGSGLLARFEPAQKATRETAIEPLNSLAQLSDYGTVSDSGEPQPQPVPDAAAAGALSGMRVLTPAVLPPGVSGVAAYNVISGRSTTFTLGVDKARAAAAAHGGSLPPVPQDIQDSILRVDVHAAVLAVYRGSLGNSAASVARQTPPAPGIDAGALDLPGVPQLVVGQTLTPTIGSIGASPSRIEQYLLDQPGISPELAAAIRALGNPSAGAGAVAMAILPVPVGDTTTEAHSVQVQGVNGLAIADQAGLGAGLIWQKDGIVYVVAGPTGESQLLAVANSLG